jgi:hypothetical protein
MDAFKCTELEFQNFQRTYISNVAVTWLQDVGLGLSSIQRRHRDIWVPDLYDCSNIEGKEKGGHASDVHCAAISQVSIFSLPPDW